VAKQCPSLTDIKLVLSFDMDDDNINHFRSLSCFLRSLKHLKNVAVPSLDRAALHYIAELPTVVSLHLTNQFPVTISITPGSRPFASLKILDIWTTVNVVSGIITLLKHALITCIVVTWPKRTISDKIAQHYVAVVANCSRSSVRTGAE
jgi:hypothetical protein